MSLLSSRRRPYPFNARMGSILGSPNDRIGYMLVPNQEGLMIAKKQQMLDSVVPSVQEYGSAPVYRERTFPLRPIGGYGERVQSSYGDKRYYWGTSIQVVGGLFGKGPLMHPVAPAGVVGWCVKFIDQPIPGSYPVQFILAGYTIYRRTDDTDAGQVVDKNFSPDSLRDAVIFQGGFAGAQPSLYVCTNGGNLWERTPVGTWTQCTLPAGWSVGALEVVGTELWGAALGTCVIRKCEADPKVATNWSGPYVIGSPAVAITSIRQTNNQLTIFKQDGSVYTLNADGSTNDLFPGLRGPLSGDNGLRSSAWLGSLWFTAGPSFYRLDVPGNQLTPSGPGKMLDNASPVRGTVQNFVGWGGFRAYATLWNAATNTGYLLSYGNWEPRETDQGTTWAFDDQWDGSLAEWTGRTPTAMGVSGASGSDRLYIGFSDGKWEWFKLTQNALAADSGAEFITGPSEIVFPLHHAMFQADLKHWLGFSVFGPVMRPGDEVQLYYRIMASAGAPPMESSGDWLYLGEFIKNGQRIDTPPNMVGNALSLKASLSNTNQNDTPVIEIVAYHERVVPAFKRDLQFTIDARGFQSRLDGAALRFDSDQMHQQLLGFAAQPGSLAIELPDETVNEVAVFGYSERMLPQSAGGGRAWGVDIQATQFRILTRYGIIRRLKGTPIGDLKGYTIGSLKAL